MCHNPQSPDIITLTITKMLQAIKYDPENRTLEVLDQLKLPHTQEYIPVKTAEDAFDVIYRMAVRGAPAIAIVGVLGVAVDVNAKSNANGGKVPSSYVTEKLEYVVGSRPTAVNLGAAASELSRRLEHVPDEEVAEKLLKYAEAMLDRDLADNMAIGANGASWARTRFGSKPFSVVTICNTGSLATAGYGTALGIIRSLHSAGLIKHVYALETRPYLQGARLTAFELVHDGIPSTLITDSMAAALMRSDPDVKLAVVGADRVAANGDTANKIGTYELAIVAKHHGVKFVVAAPTTSVDTFLPSGDLITIEERPAKELTHVQGVPMAAPGIGVWNPGFDVTPANLIDAIVTEKEAKIPDASGVYNMTI